MATILYARVSTADQTLDHQRTQAEAAGFKLDDVVADHGVSGVSTKLAERPGGRRLFDMLRAGDTLVVRWVDRLGRNYDDAVATIQTFMRRGVVVRTIINGMVFDGATRDPIQKAVRDALIGFMAATAQAQAEATKAAQKAGIEHAKGRQDVTTYRGRKPSFTREQLGMVRSMLAEGAAHGAVAKATGLSRQTVYRIQEDPAKAEAALAVWGEG
jgi:DNA invertase Pin-like site-specific DNA recombinase